MTVALPRSPNLYHLLIRLRKEPLLLQCPHRRLLHFLPRLLHHQHRMAPPQQAVATQCQLRDQVQAQGATPNDYGGFADVQFDSPAS